MTDAAAAASTPVPPPTRRPRNRVGITALVIALFTVVAPIVTWIVLGIVGAVESRTFDDAIYVGVIGGMLFFFGMIALLSPLSVVAVVLGIVSLFRGGRKAPGVIAIIIGVIGSFGLFGLPIVLGEIVPGF
jgi:hypothetical protein